MSDVFGMGPGGPSLIGKRALAPDFAPSEVNGVFYGLDDELVAAPYRAALSVAATVNLLAAPVAGAFGRDAQDKWFSTMVDAPLRTLEELDQRSAINGVAARVVGELGRVAFTAPLGPVGVGAVEAGRRFGLEERAGNENALALASISGATMAVGFALPMALPVKAGWGPALLQRMGFGVGSNVALGVAQRGAEGALGEEVEAMDGLALTLDAALGAFFGGAAHIHGRLTGEAADAAMTMVEQASAQRAVPPGVAPQQALDHFVAKAKAAAQGQEIPDPLVPPEAARLVDEQASAAEVSLRASEPALARLEEPGAGQPEPMPKIEPAQPQEPEGAAAKPDAGGDARPAPAATAWNPVSHDGEAVAFDLPALQQSAAQLDALGVTLDDRKASEVLAEATKAPEDAAALLDAVTQCAMNYGH